MLPWFSGRDTEAGDNAAAVVGGQTVAGLASDPQLASIPPSSS